MLKKLQNWSPDTCGCRFREQWDSDAPMVPATFDALLASCPEHAVLTGPKAYAAVYSASDSEQKRKNQMEGFLKEDVILGLGELKDSSNQFKAGTSYHWSFTGTGEDRVLHIEVRGVTLSSAQRSRIESEATTAYGAGQVVLD